jgi:hypothetical protein
MVGERAGAPWSRGSGVALPVLLGACVLNCGGKAYGFSSGLAPTRPLSSLTASEAVELCRAEFRFFESLLTPETFCLGQATTAPGGTLEEYRDSCRQHYQYCQTVDSETMDVNRERVYEQCGTQTVPVVGGFPIRKEGCDRTVEELERCHEAAARKVVELATVSCDVATFDNRTGREAAAIQVPECAPLRSCLE